MKKLLLVFTAAIAFHTLATAQAKKMPGTSAPASISRPKLVIGLVVDQMRWDYLYRFYDRYSAGGFKRLINEGFSAENTFIPYVPTYTACGHASVYTGSIPAINGIIGNSWYDYNTESDMYCTDDSTATSVGSSTNAGQMSPKNLKVTTITDELRLATNFKSKVIGISLKDRGSILPAGHAANAAYWYDGKIGNWISSSWYMKELPVWLADYNKLKLPNKYYAQDWNTLYPISTYTQSSADDVTWEGKLNGAGNTAFPHSLKNAVDKNFDLIRTTPYGNTLTLDLAKTAIAAEKLGQGSVTDFLAVSCSSTDYIGHMFGPNSVEIEDTYLRLDRDMADFFSYLDKTIGTGNYLLFLTADHAAAHVPAYLKEKKLPGGLISNTALSKALNSLLEKEFNKKELVVAVMNNQVIYNRPLLDDGKTDFEKVKKLSIDYLKKQEGIANAVDLTNLSKTTLTDEFKKRITNGYNAKLSGDVYFILQPNWFDGGSTGTTHGAIYPYDAHIPLVFMGWHVKPGKSNQTHYMTDIAATLAAMLHIQMPSGCVGEPITEITH
ncbi:alkaline phosphatase family protein [Pedobacter sp. MC2016-14]|uniref:alkaline phosphatase PafA n=1 Tax=Pedobacter sp. MC2016-14 TaxID=2897327 RepID=UPI001E418A76|nr:alkaline phosphatase PafA [Pedobacter sp. MC2016-14]MCD0489046.1 alkaline phosphatase family protein [Pedobacter sp. MC2016-14]